MQPVSQPSSPSAQEAILSAFLAQFPDLTPPEAEEIARRLVVRTYPRGTVLLRAGDISRQCYFVLQGCLRLYQLRDGVERTVEFYTEQQAVALFSSYASQSASDSTLVCLEDSLVLVGDFAREAEMYRQFPKLEAITRRMVEQDFGRAQEAFARFMASSPEERYQHILQTRPGLLQRVPQHQLASYIGVTPESLSRIRRRLMQAR